MPRNGPRPLCSYPACGRPHWTKGFCTGHAWQLRTHGELRPIVDNHKIPFAERFSAKLVRSDSGCLLWTGSVDSKGYGTVQRDGVTLSAHRAAWELKHGPVTDGLHVLHKCDNPPCCEDSHLFTGTHTDNMRDMVAKGRLRGGRLAVRG